MMRQRLGFIYGICVLIVASAVAFVMGTLMILPFLVVKRGKREVYTVEPAGWWSRFVLWVLLLARVRVSGGVQIGRNKGRGALIICNHRSWADVIMLVAWTRSQGLSKKSVLWIPFIGLYGYLSGAVFFDRSSPEARKQARKDVMWMIQQGARVHMFPEGTRTRDGKLAEDVRLTLPMDCFEAGVPVIPCAVMNTDRLVPAAYAAAFPLQTAYLHIGETLYPEDFPDAASFANAAWGIVKTEVARLEVQAVAEAAS